MRSGILNKINIEEILGMSKYEFLKEAVTSIKMSKFTFLALRYLCVCVCVCVFDAYDLNYIAHICINSEFPR